MDMRTDLQLDEAAQRRGVGLLEEYAIRLRHAPIPLRGAEPWAVRLVDDAHQTARALATDIEAAALALRDSDDEFQSTDEAAATLWRWGRCSGPVV